MQRIITVVSAGLRTPSSTRLLADRLAAAARDELARREPGATLDIRTVELRELAHAIADALLTGFPTGALAHALADVAHADGLIVVTPTFQASYSGLFKSFIDLLEEDAVRDTPVALAATGGTERYSLVIDYALRPLFAYLKAQPLATGVYAATADFGGAGSAALERRIGAVARELADRVAGSRPGTRAGTGALVGAGTEPAPADALTDFVPFEQLLTRAR